MRPNRMTLAVAAIALAACTSSPAGTTGSPTTAVGATPVGSTTTSGAAGEVIELKDARLKFEINSTDLDGEVQVFIDADLWKEMSIFDPDGL